MQAVETSPHINQEKEPLAKELPIPKAVASNVWPGWIGGHYVPDTASAGPIKRKGTTQARKKEMKKLRRQ
jgi:hypothetical protein